MAELHDLELETRPLEGVPKAALVRIAGKGGPAAVRRLQAAIQPLLAEGTTRLLFDCARLEFFNSTALGYLITLADSVAGAGGTVSFCRVPKKVQVAFDLLGLQDFFRFYPDESQAARSWKESSAPRAASAPARPAPAGAPVPRTVEPPPPVPVLAALPAWLEEVDQPAPPPLDHPRWSALLQTVARRWGGESLAEICRRLGVPSGGPPGQAVRAVLGRLRTPEELLGLLDEKTLAGLGRLYGLSAAGGKDEWIGALVSFVHRSTTESLSRVAGGDREAVPRGSPPAPLEPTGESLLQALRSCPLPKLLRSERSARELLFKHASRLFGPDRVARDKPAGRHWTAKVDLDVAGRFGILVRMATPLLRRGPADQRKVLGLLGQTVLLAGAYGRGNLFIVLIGEIPDEGASAAGELRGTMEGAGGRFVHLRQG